MFSQAIQEKGRKKKNPARVERQNETEEEEKKKVFVKKLNIVRRHHLS